MNVAERQLLDKAVAALDAMEAGDDEERGHGEAEMILQTLLTELGFGDASDAFNRANTRVGFWYA